MLWGHFGAMERPKKNYIEVVTTKIFFSQNEKSQRWIDSQLNSESNKSQIILKWQKKNQKF